MFKHASTATTLIAGIFSLLCFSNSAWALDVSKVRLLADVCAVCHGTDGRGGGKIPKLKGELKVDDFVQTMQGFASGEERATVMDRVAKGLAEDDFKLLADYFATLK